MSTREISIYDASYVAGVDLSAAQYKIVSIGSTGGVALGGTIVGVLQNKPESGQAAQVRHHGISRVVVDGSGTPIAIGSPIMSSSGTGVVATAGNYAIGTALQASTTNGDTIAVLMTGPYRIHA
jgi:predicted RecA/RadA family phage recombinase